MIASSAPEELSPADQSWLGAHLDACPSCRDFAEITRETVRSLRAAPVTASARLVAATKSRVRQRAQQLQRRRERLWIVSACCAAVTLCTLITTAVLWTGFAWIGQQTQLSAPVWKIAFLVMGATPAIFTAILLLARGTHFADSNDSFIR